MVIIPEKVAVRAVTNCTDGDHGCILSLYSIRAHGYSQIGWQADGRAFTTGAHRAAWVYHHGIQIPDRMTVDHTCWTRRCVNPEHLRLLSNFENARRTFGRDWPLGTCINGHDNSELRQWGTRLRCRVCFNHKQREDRRRRKVTAT